MFSFYFEFNINVLANIWSTVHYWSVSNSFKWNCEYIDTKFEIE